MLLKEYFRIYLVEIACSLNPFYFLMIKHHIKTT